MALLERLHVLYNDAMEQREPLCYGYPFMDSPVALLTTVALYLLVVWQGPKFMQNRKPMNLKVPIILYNITMVIISSIICFGGMFGIYNLGGFKVFCEGSGDTRTIPDELLIFYYVNLGWLFFVSKMIEFLDTVFFILRKKNNQVTFLHVYHHTSMCMFTWVGLNFFTGGNNIAYGVVNSFIHVVMYSYYALAAFGPHMRKYLWWKKYLTKMQIGQFLILIVYVSWNEMYGCGFSRTFVLITLAYICTVLLLFINFYVRAYLSSHKPQPHKDTVTNGHVHGEGESQVNGAVKKLN
ncbi:elongation of very long chain fatty acids protein 4-like [Physella acuta]|uniref:elongation of very long chain fatty acids protein 4-like n=1 Tax=Physella acuta TaxID=109671 RepID=UPI0027DB1773|nr:elongation of very long chain fatty acids protein 4-like [Physella acuta]